MEPVLLKQLATIGFGLGGGALLSYLMYRCAPAWLVVLVVLAVIFGGGAVSTWAL